MSLADIILRMVGRNVDGLVSKITKPSKVDGEYFILVEVGAKRFELTANQKLDNSEDILNLYSIWFAFEHKKEVYMYGFLRGSNRFDGIIIVDGIVKYYYCEDKEKHIFPMGVLYASIEYLRKKDGSRV